jgi:hypothetical protein
LSECAGREQKGGTFHFGNVQGLALTILGIDTSVFRPLFLLPLPLLAQQAHQCVESASKGEVL